MPINSNDNNGAQSSPSQTQSVFTGGSSTPVTELSSGTGSPTVMDNNKPSAPTNAKPTVEEPDGLSYSQKKDKKEDPLTDKAIAAMQKSIREADERLKQLRAEKPQAHSLADVYDVFKHNLKVSRNECKKFFDSRKLDRLQDSEHPYHRKTLEDVVKDINYNDKFDSVMKQDERQRGNLKSLLMPDALKRGMAHLKLLFDQGDSDKLDNRAPQQGAGANTNTNSNSATVRSPTTQNNTNDDTFSPMHRPGGS